MLFKLINVWFVIWWGYYFKVVVGTVNFLNLPLGWNYFGIYLVSKFWIKCCEHFYETLFTFSNVLVGYLYFTD